MLNLTQLQLIISQAGYTIAFDGTTYSFTDSSGNVTTIADTDVQDTMAAFQLQFGVAKQNLINAEASVSALQSMGAILNAFFATYHVAQPAITSTTTSVSATATTDPTIVEPTTDPTPLS